MQCRCLYTQGAAAYTEDVDVAIVAASMWLHISLSVASVVVARVDVVSVAVARVPVASAAVARLRGLAQSPSSII